MVPPTVNASELLKGSPADAVAVLLVRSDGAILMQHRDGDAWVSPVQGSLVGGARETCLDPEAATVGPQGARGVQGAGCRYARQVEAGVTSSQSGLSASCAVRTGRCVMTVMFVLIRSWYHSWYHQCMAMTLRLDDGETEALRSRAELEGRSMQDVARQAVRDYIERTSRRQLLDRVLDSELPRYSEALERLGQ